MTYDINHISVIMYMHPKIALFS